MHNEHEDNLKSRLNEAAPEALGYRPDREKIWAKVNARPAAKVWPLGRWFSHAAAVAAGLVLGFFLWPGTTEKQEERVAVHPDPVPQLIRDTVYMAATTAETAQTRSQEYTAARARSKPAQSGAAPGAAPVTDRPITPSAPDPRTPAPALAGAAPGATRALPETTPPRPQQMPVLHLADIGNENAPHPSMPAPQHMYAFKNILKKAAHQEDPSQTLSMMLSEHFRTKQ